MKNLPYWLLKIWLPFVLAFGLAACEPFANPYSAEAYKQATALKAQSLQLIQQGSQHYHQHAQTADALLLSISEAYEFAKGRGRKHTDEAAQQWAIIRDPNVGSMGAFIKQWKSQGTMNAFFVSEFSQNVSKQFDAVISLETGRKTSE